VAHDLVPSTAQVLPEGQRGLRPARSTAAVLGAAAIVFVAVAALVALVARGDGPSDEALLVLPVGDWQLRDGGITAPIDDSDVPAADERFIVEGSLYGFADGDGFDNLRSFVLYRASPLPGSSWEPVETEAGGSFRRLDQPMTLARQESDDVWRVASTPSDLVNAYSTLIDDIPSGMVLVAVFDSLDAPPAPTASFVMTSPAGATFTVESTTGSPLFDATTFAEASIRSTSPASPDGSSPRRATTPPRRS
jgi:hypothetical protein